MATKVYIQDLIVIIDRDGDIEPSAPIAKATGMTFRAYNSPAINAVGIEDIVREKIHWIPFTDFQNEAGTAISTETTIRAYLAPLLG